MNRLILFLVLGVFVLFWPGIAEAQHSIVCDVVGGGGGQSTDGSSYLQGTVGEMAIGIYSNPTNLHKSGYWYCVDALHIGPTSAVLITAFEASPLAHEVEPRWDIGSADGLKGFNIYRSEDGDGPFEQINASLILPVPGEFLYHDTRVQPRTSYWYRLGAVDSDGEFFSQVVSVETPAAKTTLHQNYPNPFNPQTTISFYLTKREMVHLTIYDTQGKQIRKLLSEPRDFGSHEILWNGRNDQGEEAGSGVYFCRLVAGKTAQTKKLTILK
jgi:hypothetical protein